MKFTSLLKQVLLEVTQYSHSLDPSIQKLPKEFIDFYTLNFRQFLFNKGTSGANEVKRKIEEFEEFCKKQPIETLTSFLNWAKIGIEKFDPTDIKLPTGLELEERLDLLLKVGNFDQTTTDVVNSAIQNYAKGSVKQKKDAYSTFTISSKKIDEDNTLSSKEKARKKKELKDKYEHEERRIGREYTALLTMEMNNLKKKLPYETAEQNDIKNLRISIIEKAIDKAIENMLKQQNELLMNRNVPVADSSSSEITKLLIQINNSSDTLINSVRTEWNNVIRTFNSLSKNILDRRDEFELSKKVGKEYKMFIPLFFKKEDEISVSQYDDILNKSFLNKLSPRFEYYLDAIKENKSRKKELIIQKIVSVLKKEPTELKGYKPASILKQTASIYGGGQIGTPAIADISQDDINKEIDLLNKISEDDIKHAFKKDLFGYFQNRISTVSKLLNNPNSMKYKPEIKKAIDDFENKMLDTALSIPPEELKTYNNPINRIEGILNRIGLDDIKDKIN
jgi:hypothetical protein